MLKVHLNSFRPCSNSFSVISNFTLSLSSIGLPSLSKAISGLGSAVKTIGTETAFPLMTLISFKPLFSKGLRYSASPIKNMRISFESSFQHYFTCPKVKELLDVLSHHICF